MVIKLITIEPISSYLQNCPKLRINLDVFFLNVYVGMEPHAAAYSVLLCA